MSLNQDAFLEVARGDFEFKHEARYLTGLIKLDFGGSAWALAFDEGSLTGIADGRKIPDADCKIVVGGTKEQWDALLELKSKALLPMRPVGRRETRNEDLGLE